MNRPAFPASSLRLLRPSAVRRLGFYALCAAVFAAPARADSKNPSNTGLDADLAVLPHYKPERQVGGILRNVGGPLGGLVPKWEDGFVKFQPKIKFMDHILMSEVVSVALTLGIADFGTAGDLIKRVEMIPYVDVFGTVPFRITIGTGSLEIGSTPALVIVANKDNPIGGLSLRQLDGIFGSARSGGWGDGFVLRSSLGRSAKDDIRTWGQLGVTGEWADKVITTYGYSVGGFGTFFEQRVLKGAEINWNPNYRQYAVASRTPPEEGDAALTIPRMFRDLASDRYCLGWGPYEMARHIPELKSLPLSETDGGPYVALSAQTLRDRTYPLVRDTYIYTNRLSGQDVDPKVKEFIRYVLSYEGQAAATEDGRYFPLPSAMVRSELKKLE